MTAMTTYEARAADAWRLVHDEGQPMRKVAAALQVSLSEAYEMLAHWKAMREMSERRRAVMGNLKAASFHSEKWR